MTNAAYQKGTVITIRVKKSEIDSFAQGKVSLDDFTKQVSIAAYPGSGYGITSVNSWIQSGRNSLPVVR